MDKILVLMTAVGLCLMWALAGTLLLPLAVIAWAVKTLQRGLRWVQMWGGA